MKRIDTLSILLLLGIFFASYDLSGQHMEIGLNFGVTNYSGDLQNKSLELNTVRQSVSAFAKYNHNYRLTGRFQVSYVPLRGSDQYSYRSGGNYERNLSFQSSIMEVSTMIEYNLISFNPSEKMSTTIYAMAGVAGFHHNPKALHNGEWVELQPLGTEGQLITGDQYSKIQVAIPMGFGIKLALNERINATFEMNFRKTFTDYIDDVSTTYPDFSETDKINELTSQLSFRPLMDPNLDKAIDIPVSLEGIPRGNPEVKDWYYTMDLGFSYRLGTRKKMLYNQKMISFIK